MDKSLSYRANAEGLREKHIGEAKTLMAKRVVPMSDGVKAAFQRLKEKQDMIRTLDVKAEIIDGYKDFIFITERGTVQTVDYLTLKIKKIVTSYNKQETACAKKEEREGEMLPLFTAISVGIPILLDARKRK